MNEDQENIIEQEDLLGGSCSLEDLNFDFEDLDKDTKVVLNTDGTITLHVSDEDLSYIKENMIQAKDSKENREEYIMLAEKYKDEFLNVMSPKFIETPENSQTEELPDFIDKANLYPEDFVTSLGQLHLSKDQAEGILECLKDEGVVGSACLDPSDMEVYYYKIQIVYW